MSEQQPKSRFITWSEPVVPYAERVTRNGHQGAVLWFTGLSASGKSTISRLVEKALFQRGCQTYILDGDNVRHGLNSDLGFSPQDREENIRRIGEVAKLMMDAGVIALTAFISPYRADRDRCRKIVPEGNFFEVFCACPISVCETRDPKGLYKRARAGEIPEFTGISAPYEEPLAPELVLPTHELTPEECVQEVLAALEARGILCPNGVLAPGQAG